MQFEHTLSPLKIGKMTLRNRLIMPPMGSNLAADDGSVNDRYYSYMVERAKGGFGLVMMEVTSVSEKGYSILHEPAIWDDKFIPGLTRLADGVHKYGGKICCQLHHGGREAIDTTQTPIAPSAIKAMTASASIVPSHLPRELTNAEVWELIEQFSDAALRAKKAGIDCVEVHGAHQYLIAQFTSPYSNKRTDEFGGSFENRMRFPLEVVKGIRRKCGDDYPILYRLSGNERVMGGRTIHHSQLVARYMAEVAGVDAVHVSVGTAGTAIAMVAPSNFPEGHLLDDARAIKEVVTKVPVIAVGRLHEPHFIEMVLDMGWADGVSVGRQSIADPYFPNKIASGKTNEICRCLSCQQGCIGRLNDDNYLSIYCLMNPYVAREYKWESKEAENKKKIVVVGAGPAGMQFAWTAAQRGHQVVILEEADRVGGQMILAGLPPTKDTFLGAVLYWQAMCDKYGVEIKLNTEATPEAIAAENPDAVVVATGAKPTCPNFKGLDEHQALDAWDVLQGKSPVGYKALVIGGGMVGCETADFLAHQGHDVTIIEMMPELASDMAQWENVELMGRISSQCELIAGAKVSEITADGVKYEKDGKEEQLSGFNSVIMACGAKSYNPLAEKLADFPEVHYLGDVVKAAKAIDATETATALALEI